jgi:hypothetical protein
MSELICPPGLSKIYLQVPGSELTLIAVLTVVIAVVLLGILLMLAFRRRPHLRTGLLQHHLPTPFHHTGYASEASPTATALEMLGRDLEEASAAYSAGHLDKKTFDERVSDIKRTFEDLKHFKEITSPNKNCEKCSAEIAKEARFCDRCGAQQD